MVRMLLGVLCAHATAELQELAADGSLDQVRTTLESLLQDLETEMESSTDAVREARDWCELSLKQRKQADASAKLELKRMASELKEGEEALGKARATVEQLKAEQASAKHTLSQTRDLVKRTREQSASFKGKADGQLKQRLRGVGVLEEKRREVSSSLQGKMQIALLAHAQREAQVSEARHRIKDRQNTADAEQSFTETFAADCDKLTLPELNLESRRPEAKYLDKLVQLFQQEIAPPVTTSTTTLPPVDEAAIEAAEQAADEFAKEDADSTDFLQVDKQISETDVLALLTGGDMDSSQPRPRVVAPHHPARRARRAHRERAGTVTKQIGQLLQQVKGGARASLKHQQWCQFEDRQNDMSLRLASGLVSQLTAEIDASEEVEDRLEAFARALQRRSGALAAVGSKMAALAGDAEGRLAGSAKRRELGGKILERAAKIVKARAGPGNVEGAFATALKLIQKTQAGLNTTGQVAAMAKIEVVDVKSAIAQQVEDLKQAQDHELADALSMKDDRAVRRGSFEETRQAYEAEVEAAKQYASKLAQECSGSVFAKASGRQNSEIRALEEARAVLSGKKPTDVAAQQQQQQGPRELSPLEKAALRLGVAVN